VDYYGDSILEPRIVLLVYILEPRIVLLVYSRYSVITEEANR
jgi:hypothetical protein